MSKMGAFTEGAEKALVKERWDINVALDQQTKHLENLEKTILLLEERLRYVLLPDNVVSEAYSDETVPETSAVKLRIITSSANITRAIHNLLAIVERVDS